MTRPRPNAISCLPRRGGRHTIALPPDTLPKSHRLTKLTGGRRHTFNLSKALKLRMTQHLSYDDIAEIMHVAPTSILKALKPFENLIQHPEAYHAAREAMPELLDSAKLTLLRSMIQPDKLEKASCNNLAYAMTQVDTISRLDRGQSTSNVSGLLRVITDAHLDLPRRLRALPHAEVEDTTEEHST